MGAAAEKGQGTAAVGPSESWPSWQEAVEGLADGDAQTHPRRAGADLAWRGRGALVAGACTGTFVLAQSGVLDRRRATTTWWLEPVFRRRFPRVRLDAGQMVVVDGHCVTAGAALGHVDLALWLVRRSSPQLARLTARYLLFGGRPFQATYALTDHLVHDDELISRFERWTRDHLREFSVVGAAKAVGVSQRTLQRRFQRVLGRTPVAYAQDIRVEQALQQLRTTDRGLDEIAEDVGYADGSTLRTLLRRRTGSGLRELRRG